MESIMTFESLGLSADLLRAVADKGYTAPTPIQLQAIPVVLEGRDLMASAQTGTGKTAAFTLPMLQRLGSAGRSRHRVRALVLVPTRELAAQVAESVRAYGRHLPLKCAQVFGGVNINPQMRELRAGVDILVATPGRLIDHLERRTVSLAEVEMLVLDEADRMLDMGFLPAIERIVKQLSKERQTLLFSATFSEPIRALAHRFMNAPQAVDVAPPNAAATAVAQSAYWVDAGRKRELLAHLIDSNTWQQVLVFTRTKRGADRLAKQLDKAGIESAAIHGDKSQGARTRALADFKRLHVRALVATDVAARGLDIRELPHVVNFDMPHNPEDYVHRIGRTGRAGQSGSAISLVSAEERSQFAAIKRLVKLDIPATVAAGFEPQAGVPAMNRDAPHGRPAPRNGQHRPKAHRKGQSHGKRAAQPGNARGHGPHAAHGQGDHNGNTKGSSQSAHRHRGERRGSGEGRSQTSSRERPMLG
jgi:ATP-dependent RNA helicase RhlE